MRSDLVAHAEMDLIRGILRDPSQFKHIEDLTPSKIYSPIARAIWSVVYEKRGVVAATTLYDDLGTFEEGRKVYEVYPDLLDFRAELWGNVLDDENIDEIGNAVRSAYKQRHYELITQEFNTSLDIDTLLDYKIRELRLLRHEGVTILEDVDKALEAGFEVARAFEWKQKHPTLQLGWKCGDPQYDKFLRNVGGLDGEKLVVVGALSGEGKSQWLINQARGYATTPRDTDQKIPKVVLISTEMGTRAIADRVCANWAQVNTSSTTTSPDAIQRLYDAAQRWKDLIGSGHLRIIEHMSNIDEIAKAFAKLKDKDQIDIGIIDYIGMLQSSGPKGDKASSYQSIGDIAKAMQNICLELQIPIVTAAQLNRETYKGPGGKPSSSNIADSIAIKHAASIFHLMWRPDLHSFQIAGESAGHWKDVMIMLTDKIRHAGPAPHMYYHFNGEFSQFTEIPPSMRKILQSEKEQKRILGIKV